MCAVMEVIWMLQGTVQYLAYNCSFHLVWREQACSAFFFPLYYSLYTLLFPSALHFLHTYNHSDKNRLMIRHMSHSCSSQIMQALASDGASQVILGRSSYRLGILMPDHGRAGTMETAHLLEVDVYAAVCKTRCIDFAHGGVARSIVVNMTVDLGSRVANLWRVNCIWSSLQLLVVRAASAMQIQ